MKRPALGGPALRLVLLALVAVGCTTTLQWIYDKPGMTPETLDRDRAACRAASPPQGMTRMLSIDDVDRNAFTACMQRRGYNARREAL